MSDRCAVVGLGDLGATVAGLLTAGGARVVGVEGDQERRTAWCAGGGEAVAGLAELAGELPERIFVVVRTNDQAAAVLTAVEAAAERATTVHLVTTLDVEWACTLATREPSLVRVLEQPVSRGAEPHTPGLLVLTAGPLTADDRAFLLGALATRLVEFPRYGEPTLVKLLNNALAAAITELTAAAVSQAAASGLPPELAAAVFRHASGASAMGGFLPGLHRDQLELLVKDVALWAAAAPRDAPLTKLPADFVDRVLAAQAASRPASSV